MTNKEAIDLAKRAISPCKGATLQALQIVIAMAEKYNTACDEAARSNGCDMRDSTPAGGNT